MRFAKGFHNLGVKEIKGRDLEEHPSGFREHVSPSIARKGEQTDRKRRSRVGNNGNLKGAALLPSSDSSLTQGKKQQRPKGIVAFHALSVHKDSRRRVSS